MASEETTQTEAKETAPTAPAAPTAPKTFFWGTGRRKSSVARVRVFPGGTGRFMVNGKALPVFLPVERLRHLAASPLECTEKGNTYDIHANVDGGGITGQAGSLRLGIARALMKIEPELEHTLREKGHLTRDSRMKERKHYGLRGARRGTQFSKR